MSFLLKLVQWIPVNLVGILGIVQAIIKVLKEVLTAIVNLIFPFTPDNGKFETIVVAVRKFVDMADSGVEKVKSFLLNAVGLSK